MECESAGFEIWVNCKQIHSEEQGESESDSRQPFLTHIHPQSPTTAETFGMTLSEKDIVL